MSSGKTITHLRTLDEVELLEAHPYHLDLVSSAEDLPPEHALSWRLERRIIRLGSLSSSDVILSHPTVSRRHARIELDMIGYRLIDEESKNGVRVNQVRIRDAYIEDGDTIHIGGISLRFSLHKQQLSRFPIWTAESFGELYGTSTTMRELFAMLDRVSRSETSVLIHGESGTGKELAARAVHDRSSRSTKPFVVFDCSAVPNSLVESELFGHVKGAFTGALNERLGAFATADGGTLFLDEIGELPIDLQPKLLRVLERGEIKRLGEDIYRPVHVRVISATHRNLKAAIHNDLFRADLYYRLAVVQIQMPPLRDHPEDIPGLVERLIKAHSTQEDREVGFKTMSLLLRHHWPGNVRELKNYVQRALALSAPEEIKLDTRFLLPEELIAHQAITDSHAVVIDDVHPQMSSSAIDGPVTLREAVTHQERTQLDTERLAHSERADLDLNFSVKVDIDQAFKEAKHELIERFERRYWRALLNAHDFNISAAARVAGIHRKSAEYLIKKLKLKASYSPDHSDDH